MAKVMLTTKLAANATFEDAVRRLGVDESLVDRDFGLVNIDPEQHLYAVLVDESAATGAATRAGVNGPFSNPKIETLGPPE